MDWTFATVPDPGGYYSPIKLVVMFVLVVPWFYAAAWASRDAGALRHVDRTVWSLVVLATGALGILLWLVVPMFVIGLVLYLILGGGGLITYVMVRNGQVEASQRVLTGSHLSGLFGGGGGGRRRKATPEVENKVKVYGANHRVVLPPEPPTATPEQVHAYNLAQDLLYKILWRRASDADLSPSQGGVGRLLLVIDGVPTQGGEWSVRDSETVIQFLKQHGGMDTEDRRRPQQGRISAEIVGTEQSDIVLASKGTTSGQRIQFRVEQETAKTVLNDLGMAEDQLARVRQILAEPGLVIVAGPPKSGVTSTLYSFMRDYDAFTKLLMTVENKPAVELENITQHTYDEDAERAERLANALRRDPNVVGVDRCTDPKTAAVIADATNDKTIILGMQAGDTVTALAKWVKICSDAETAMRHLRLVTCQTLLRKLCPSCKEAYRPDPAVLAKANLKSQKIDRFYRPPKQQPRDENGAPIVCGTCQGSGYFGRTAAYEMLEVTEDIRNLVLSGATVSEIKAECRRAGMLYLQEQALRKVIAGETSIAEVIRVTQDAKKKKK